MLNNCYENGVCMFNEVNQCLTNNPVSQVLSEMSSLSGFNMANFSQLGNLLKCFALELYNSNGVSRGLSGFRSALGEARQFSVTALKGFNQVTTAGSSMVSQCWNAISIPEINENSANTYTEFAKNNWLSVLTGVAGAIYFKNRLTSLWSMHNSLNVYDMTTFNIYQGISILAPSHLCTTGVAMAMQVAAMTTCAISTFAPIYPCSAFTCITTCAVAAVSYKLAANALYKDLYKMNVLVCDGLPQFSEWGSSTRGALRELGLKKETSLFGRATYVLHEPKSLFSL